MKRFILFIIFITTIGFCDSVLIVKQGWQLIGASQNIDDMSVFKPQDVEQVWYFDATTQKWLGYSSDETVQQKITDSGIGKLTNLKNWHGFWVKSKQEWNFNFPNITADLNKSSDTIEIKKGWNLISLPIDKIISPNIFEGMVVWKYNPNRNWELFNKSDTDEKFPRLNHIKNSDGLWVKSPNDKTISLTNEIAKLHNFTSQKQMESFITDMLTLNNQPYWGIMPFFIDMPMDDAEMTLDFAPAPMAEEGSTNMDKTTEVTDTTSTNLQESDVDEADIVKHNGKNIFYLVKSANIQTTPEKINITTFSQLLTDAPKPLNEIILKNQRVDSIYLVNNRLIVLSNWQEISEQPMEDMKIAPYIPVIPKLMVQVFDVSDIANIKTLSTFKVDGNMITSRMVGENLFLVSSFYPKVNISYPKIYFELPECTNIPPIYPTNYEDKVLYNKCYSFAKDANGSYYKYDYQNPITEIEQLTPQIIQDDGAEKPLLTPATFYASSVKKQSPTITTISKISTSLTPTFEQSVSIIGYSSGHYASSKSFYLVSNQYPFYYDFNNYKHRSAIYKFNLEGELKYSGLGFVDGGILNQFSLSEHNDILRIATTEGFSWSGEGTDNSIYNLKEVDSLLEIQSVLSGLGKEGEVIKSVRFMGNRAYVVTFRQTDPFYTIDLSDPLAPKKMGELQVDGYSAYLHPVSENQILGIGRDADEEGRVNGVKIELFDVSDFANPTSLDSQIIGGRGTYSELENDHKALAYRASDNLFAFPYQSYDYYNYKTDNFLGIYQIEGDSIKVYTPIQNYVEQQVWSKHRGLIFDANSTTYVSHFVNDNITTRILEK